MLEAFDKVKNNKESETISLGVDRDAMDIHGHPWTLKFSHGSKEDHLSPGDPKPPQFPEDPIHINDWVIFSPHSPVTSSR